MIVFNISRLNFLPSLRGVRGAQTPQQQSNDLAYDKHAEFKGNSPSYIEIRNIWGKLIYRIEKKGSLLHLKNFTFDGQFDSLKIFREANPLIDSFRVQLYCENCGDCLYLLSAKLPLLMRIKTDFYVIKD